ncbi:hypothetical protein CBI38_18025 [Rhodococcus oxybenzonivorans]|uniref:Uncharacterized protein n=2 Tax=Rhodococcus oxybenzonivorans TaxID=1990687 RepID=A0A2S2BX55_9NOCA|nr:hypothetical protein [Rhodococcus oxybenzonivorans]AWK73173.1 hypothetical protein CBI38_18025 [Rhodococcus oxybenzonivorans]
MSSRSRSIAGHIGNAVKRDPSADTTPLRRDLAASRIQDVVEAILADAPPLTPEQVDRLAAILRGGA